MANISLAHVGTSAIGSIRTSFVLSNGNRLFIYSDTNPTTTPDTYGDHSGTPKLNVVEYSDASGVVNRASLALPAGFGSVLTITGALFANNDLAILISGPFPSKQIYYSKFTYSSGAMSAWASLITGTLPSNVKLQDADVDDYGSVVVSYRRTDSSSIVNYLAVLKTGGGWVHSAFGTAESGTSADGWQTATLTRVSGGSSTASRFVIAIGYGTYSGSINTMTNNILRVYKFSTNPSTGAVTPVGTAVNMYNGGFKNVASARARTARLYASSLAVGGWVMGVWFHEASSSYGFTYTGNFTSPTQPFVLATMSNTYPPVAGAASAMLANWAYDDQAGLTVTYASNSVTGLNGFTDVSYLTGPLGSIGVMSGPFNYHQSEAAVTLFGAGSGGNRNNATANKQPLMYYVKNSSDAGISLKFSEASVPVPNEGGSAIVRTTPADKAVLGTSRPLVTGAIHTGIKYDMSDYLIVMQFSQSPTFSTGVITQNTPWVRVDGTDVDETTVVTPTAAAISSPLADGTWYVRARLMSRYMQYGDWTPTYTFTVGYVPTVEAVYPLTGAVVADDGSGVVHLAWDYGNGRGVAQGSVQIQVNSNEVSIFDQVISTSDEFYNLVFTGDHGVKASWRIRAADANGVYSSWTDWYYFDFVLPTVITITSPANGDDVDSLGPIAYTASAALASVTLIVSQGGSNVWSGTAASNPGYMTIPNGIIKNHQDYTLQYVGTDIWGLGATSAPVSFSTDFPTPPAPTDLAVDISNYNVPDMGFVAITWGDEVRDTEKFFAWVLYRKDDMLDPSGLVIQEGDYKVIHIEYGANEAYYFQDFFAPTGYKSTYMVHQVVGLGVQAVESDTDTPVSCYPVSDGYWLIEPDEVSLGPTAFKLKNVTGDTFTDEQESEVFTVIGRGRVANKGEDLGFNGSLTVKVRDNIDNISRVQNQRIKAIQNSGKQVWLRNPFGDVLRVDVSGIQYVRIAGVGKSEFTDVTIPYMEVAR